MTLLRNGSSCALVAHILGTALELAGSHSAEVMKAFTPNPHELSDCGAMC